MAVKIRLSRGGSKKRPFYRIVAADERAPRDGKFLEKLGTYNPMLPKGHESRIKLDIEKIKFWLGRGAQPTDRIRRFLEDLEIFPKKKRNNPNKAKVGQKRADRAEAKAEKAKSGSEETSSENAAE